MLYNKEKNIIETDRLILRKYKLEDADDLAKICNNYNIYKYTMNIPYPYEKQNAIDYINFLLENPDNYVFAITDKKTGTLYGNVSIGLKKHNKGEIGYFVGEEYWGNGIATEATKAIIEYGFKQLNLHKIFARHLEGNKASGRVMEKSGMFYEGTLKDEVIKEDKYQNVAFYGIIKESN